MSIINLFTAHKQVEINLSTGLRTGHMLAQHKYTPASGTTYVENGIFFRADKTNNDEVVLSDNANAYGPYWLHYTEELLTNGLVTAHKYFALDVEDGVCYPRLIALYAGDTFTTDQFTGTLSSSTKYGYVGSNGKLAVTDAFPTFQTNDYVGPIFKVVASTLADGTAAAQCVVLDPMATVAHA